MNQKLAKEFNFFELLRFALPSIVTMIFLSLYTIIDGFFVSTLVNTDALSAVNIVYPVNSFAYAISLMFASGGCAIVSTNMGEQKNKEANNNFTLIVSFTMIITIIFSIISIIFAEEIIILLGSNDAIFPYAIEYLRVLLLFSPMCALQILCQMFFVSAGKPNLGLMLILAGGISNIVFDYLFMGVLNMGILGAAIATGIGYCIPAIGGLIFFTKNKSGLHFTHFKLDWKTLGASAFNGSSEMVSNLSSSVTTLTFNLIMMNLLGSDGVAAITVVLYGKFLMTSLFLGFSIGVGPIISYHFGADNTTYLKKLLKILFKFTIISSVIVAIFSFSTSGTVARLFATDNPSVLALSERGIRIFSLSFLFSGFNILSSAIFTSLSNGKVSATISFSRTFVFILFGILIMTSLFKVDGVWLSIPFAELVTVSLSLFCLRKLKTNYYIF